MTRAERQRQRRKRQHQKLAAWAAVLLAEILSSAALTSLVAAPLVLFAKAERGYNAFGGEWLIILAGFCGAYYFVHNRLCNMIFEAGDKQSERTRERR